MSDLEAGTGLIMGKNGKPRAKRLREVEPGIWAYSDGSQRYVKGNKWGKWPGSCHKAPDKLLEHKITTKTAPIIRQRREEVLLQREQEREAAKRRGIVQAVIEDGADVSSFDEADEYVAKVLTREVVLTSEVPARDRIGGYKVLWGAAGAMQTEQSRPHQSIVLNISEGGLGRLAGLLRDTTEVNDSYHNHDVVDADVTELEDEP